MIPMHEVIAKAVVLGIEGAETMARTELIRAIQVKEGYAPCYGTDWCMPQWQEACMWKEECKAKTFAP